MQFRDSPSEAAFRATVRNFLAAELPPEAAANPGEWGLFNAGGRMGPGFREWFRDWTAKLNTHGWGAPAWPKEHGGGGLSVKEQFILSEEFAWRRAPRPGGIGHGWAGPTIMVYGTEQQKAGYLPKIISGEHMWCQLFSEPGAGREQQKAGYLPKIISGEHMWCQLFSEPGAGSDLASLQTRAVRDGDDYVINGQKIWTSGGHMADMGILIARTDPNAPKHRGISYFLLDMKTPGISVRPLVNMLDSHEFNEVYFEDVRVPASQLLGDENRGWYLATTTLDFERSGIATSVAHQLISRDLVSYAKETAEGKAALARNPGLRIDLADRAVEARVESLICYRIITMQERGEIPNKESSIAKLYSSELDVRLAVTAMHLAGMHAQVNDRDEPASLGGRIPRFYMHSTTSPIGGGTSEIQRNIIATRGLGMPRG